MRMSMQGVVVLGLWTLLTGCHDEKDKEIQGIEDSLASFQQKMLEDENILVRARALTTQIQKVTDLSLRRLLYAKWSDAIDSFDLARMPVDDSSRFEWARKFVFDFATTNHENAPWSFAREWESRFRYLAWLRRQIEQLRLPNGYPDGIRMTWTLEGLAHWTVAREDRPKLKEYLCRLGRYQSCAESYESMRTWWERDLVGRESPGQGEASEEVDRLKQRLANFLGRKLRTKDACNSDFDENRHHEFPYLVPTPNGLIECWTHAEVEKARRKPASRKQKELPDNHATARARLWYNDGHSSKAYQAKESET